MTEDIRLIVLTFNSRADIEECLDSLTSQGGIRKEIVVVDNGSHDDTPDVVSNKYPEIRIIRNAANLGYASGNNAALDPPLPDYVAFINPDTVSEPDWVGHAINLLKVNPNAGAVQPRVMLSADRTKLNTRGNEANFLFFAWPGGYGELPNKLDFPRRIAFASGCAAIYRTESLKRIGNFDESFFMYGEDADLGIRLFLAGLETLYCPDGVVYHKYEYRESNWKYQLLERNRLLILLKIYRRRTLLAMLPVIAASEIGVISKALSGGWMAYKMRSYGGVVKRIRELMAKRREIQNTRVRSDADLLSMLKGGIYFPAMDFSSFKRGNALLEKYRNFLLGMRL